MNTVDPLSTWFLANIVFLYLTTALIVFISNLTLQHYLHRLPAIDQPIKPIIALLHYAGLHHLLLTTAAVAMIRGWIQPEPLILILILGSEVFVACVAVITMAITRAKARNNANLR